MASSQNGAFTFIAQQPEQLTWTLKDANENPVTGATVTATLYANRSLTNPAAFPGVPITGFTNISLVEGTIPGTYAAIIQPFTTDSSQSGFVLTVTVPGIAEWDTRAVIVPPQADVDLVTLDVAKNWIGIKQDNVDADSVIQFLITGFSTYVLNKCGVTSFNSVEHYIETYDGNGNARLFVNNRPIVTLNSVTIGSFGVPISTSLIANGVYVEQTKLSIAFRNSPNVLSPPTGIYPYKFIRGMGNIQIDYTAGYTSVPYDLAEACMKAVKINYVRKDWVDLASKSLSAGGGAVGTTHYRSWALPPEIQDVLDIYSRYARP